MKRVFTIVLLLFICSQLTAQSVVLTDSNLPIVIISIDGNQDIPDPVRVLGNMKIIDRGAGERNYVSDQNNSDLLNYNGRLEIEIRGSSSSVLDKKQYGLTTLQADNTSNNNVSLLGMPKENDWVLNGLAFDDSLIRDYLSYTLSRILGVYAPRTQYCEVIINGDYKGLYILQEKIKADDNRVDILKIFQVDILPRQTKLPGMIHQPGKCQVTWVITMLILFMKCRSLRMLHHNKINTLNRCSIN
jgi:hypothetical protein